MDLVYAANWISLDYQIEFRNATTVVDVNCNC